MTGREVTPAACACLLLALIICPSTGLTTPSVPSAPLGCGPAPTALENPPEMVRVEGRIQSLELEIRQDTDRLCFVDRNYTYRPGIAPTIRIVPVKSSACACSMASMTHPSCARSLHPATVPTTPAF